MNIFKPLAFSCVCIKNTQWYLTTNKGLPSDIKYHHSNPYQYHFSRLSRQQPYTLRIAQMYLCLTATAKGKQQLTLI